MPSETSSHRFTFTATWQHLLVAPLIWLLYFGIGYGLVEVICAAPSLNIYLGGIPALSLILVTLTLIAFLGTLYPAWVAYRNWKQIRQRNLDTDLEADAPAPVRTNERESPREAEDDADHFLALSGVLLGGLFALTILIIGLPALLLTPC